VVFHVFAGAQNVTVVTALSVFLSENCLSTIVTSVVVSDGSSIKNIMDQVVINAGGQPTEVYHLLPIYCQFK